MELGKELVLAGGITDMHVHLREPGATHKEDFAHGTRAAAYGGVTTVVDMPNNPGANTNTGDRLLEKQDLAQRNIWTDVGFYYGSKPTDDNIGSFAYAARYALGLKSYLGVTTDTAVPDGPQHYREIWKAWHAVAPALPIILHAEVHNIQEALAITAGELGHPTHVAHLSSRAELETVRWARRRGWEVTCGVTPHHLFMDQYDVTDWSQRMMPPLGEPQHAELLRQSLDEIDVFETDHAPHTIAEKERANSENPTGDPEGEVTCFGVPGLEAMVPLLFSALYYGQKPIYERPQHFRSPLKLTDDMLVDKLVRNPRRILNLPVEMNTSTRVQMEQYEFGREHVHSKCGWSPYEGWLMAAKVVRVDVRGFSVIRDGELQGRPNGRVLKMEQRAA